MKVTQLSIILVTSGKQPLIRYSLLSLLCQITDQDELIVSVNSSEIAHLSFITQLVSEIDNFCKIKIVSTTKNIPVYEHYCFGIRQATNDHVIIVHDDDVYNPGMLEEIRIGFSDPDVNVVVGGLLKIDRIGKNFKSTVENSFKTSCYQDGRLWLEKSKGLYPPFCFSALAVRRSALDLRLLTANSTAADCMVVTQLALSGKVYQSRMMFATWTQLPSSTSKWALIKPGLISPWKEYLDYSQSINEDWLKNLALENKRKSLKVFSKMLFVVAIANRNHCQIDSCLKKIGEISVLSQNLLSWTRFPMIYYPLSIPCLLAVKLKAYLRLKNFQKTASPIDPCKELNLDRHFWISYTLEILVTR